MKAPHIIRRSPALTQRQRKAQLDARRGSPVARGYDAAWRRVRDAVIVARGLRCEKCKRIGAMRKRDATPSMPVLNVDHIQPVSLRPDLRLDPANLRVLCHPCHSRRTARDQGFAQRGPRVGRE